MTRRLISSILSEKRLKEVTKKPLGERRVIVAKIIENENKKRLQKIRKIRKGK